MDEKMIEKNRDVNIEKMLVDLKKYKEEMERHIEICESQILDYKYKINKYKESISNREGNVLTQVMTQLSKEEMKETSTQHSYSLPTGKIIIKKPSEKIVLNNEFNMNEIPENFVKTKQSVDFAKFKKHLRIIDGCVINMTTGEVLNDSFSVEKIPESFRLKINEGE